MRKALMISSLCPSPFHCSSIFPVRRWGSTRLFAQRDVLYEFRPLCTAVGSTVGEPTELETPSRSSKHSMLLERLRIRHLKGSIKDLEVDPSYSKQKTATDNFEALGLLDEVMGVLKQMGISLPTEIQKIGIPAVLGGKNVVMGSHTGSGKTLAYLLPIVQMMRRDEASSGILMKPRRPRAVVLCPTRELCEQVFGVAKMIGHHARFRAGLLSGGFHMKAQEDSLKSPVDMVVGTPGRLLQHIQEKNIVYGDIRYLVLDEADTMFDHGFGTDIRRFLEPLKSRASKPDDSGYQAVLVTATMTKGVRKLIDEEFESVAHLATSSFQKRVSTARHDFVDVPPSEDKLSVLLQVLEPSLRRGDRAMVFCNTLDSSRAVDHFLADRGLSSVNYHGAVPPQERVENLRRFKTDGGNGEECPTLVCTDLAARGLDMAVDHVVMFDFPLSSTDYVHRTGRTARMGAKGRVTSLVCKRDLLLATRIRDAMRRNLSLDGFNRDTVRRDAAKARTRTSRLSRDGKRRLVRRSNPVRGPAATVKARTMAMTTTSRSSNADKRKPLRRSKPVPVLTGTTRHRTSRHSNSSKQRKSPPSTVRRV